MQGLLFLQPIYFFFKFFNCAQVCVEDDLAHIGWLTADYEHMLSQVCKNKIELSEKQKID